MYSLHPLSPNRKKKDPKPFGVYDIESANWSEHIVSAFYTEHNGGYFEYFKTVKKFLDFCFSDRCEVEEIFCHFGGIFDFLFIMEAVYDTKIYDIDYDNSIFRGNSFLIMKVTSRKSDRTISFKDSSGLLPMGLDSLTKAFDVEHKKKKMDRTRIEKDTPELREYLKYDCMGTYEVLKKFSEWPMVQEVGLRSTIASQAMQILKKYLPCEVPSLNDRADKFIRQGYFGGRTEIFRPLYLGSKEKPISVFDINSLYPSVMRDNTFPTVMTGFQSTFDFKKDNGFVDCTVDVPDMYVPPLPYVGELKNGRKLIFPTGKFRGVWSSVELNYAMTLGVRVLKVHNALTFHLMVPIFRDFINEMYSIRQNAKSEVDNLIAKLIMNSCYGKFGIDRNKESLCLDTFEAGVKPLYEIHNSDGSSVWIAQKKHYLKTFSHVGIAAWVTSLARIKLHQALHENQKKIYYCDTDSLFTPNKLKHSKALGDWKHEYDIARACFLLPKTYGVESVDQIFKALDGSEKKVSFKPVMKGFQRNSLHQIKFSDMVAALEGDLRLLRAKQSAKLNKMRTAWRKDQLLSVMPETERSIKSKYDKRILFKKKNGTWDSKPLKVVNNKVIEA